MFSLFCLWHLKRLKYLHTIAFCLSVYLHAFVSLLICKILNLTILEFEQGWLVMKRRNSHKAMKSTTMVAIDCEMVLCEDGSEAVVRLCAVDRNLEVDVNFFHEALLLTWVFFYCFLLTVKFFPVNWKESFVNWRSHPHLRIFQVKLDEFVKPEKAIIDYRTDITGVTAEHLNGVNSSLANVQVCWFITRLPGIFVLPFLWYNFLWYSLGL